MSLSGAFVVNFEQNSHIFLLFPVLTLNKYMTPRHYKTLTNNTTTQIKIGAMKAKSYRSSRKGMFCKKGVLKNFAKFRGKHLCQSLFL